MGVSFCSGMNMLSPEEELGTHQGGTGIFQLLKLQSVAINTL
jgi:hypothetical protein